MSSPGRTLLRTGLTAVVAVAGLLLAGPDAGAGGARPTTIDFPDTDATLGGCLQLAPHTVAVSGERVRLDVRVVLDGVGRAEGQAAVAGVRQAYARLDVTVAATYDTARLVGRDADGLLAQAKRLYGGRRPAGSDVVYVLTDEDVVDGSPTGGDLVGLADCIGGVRYPSRAFAVGEVGSVSAPGVAQASAKTMGHEIGHLLGAHHHHTGPEGLLEGEATTPLSLMGPQLGLIALRFSQVEALVVRGHAQKYLAADRG